MRVYGELEKAQLEKLSADPTGDDLYEGRLWINTTDNITRYYDGSAVRSISDNELIGVSAGDGDLGTFTGSLISDNSSVKDALQEIEEDSMVINYYSGTPTTTGNAYETLASPSFTNGTGRLYKVEVEVNFNDSDGNSNKPGADYRLGYNSTGGSFPNACVGSAYGQFLSDLSYMTTNFLPYSAPSTSAKRVYVNIMPAPGDRGFVKFDFHVYLAAGTHRFYLEHAEINNGTLSSNYTIIKVY